EGGGGASAARRCRCLPEDPGAGEAGAAPAVRAVGRAGNADAVGIPGISRRIGAIIGLPVIAIPQDRVPARQQERRHAQGVRTRSGRAGRIARGAGSAQPVRRIPALPGPAGHAVPAELLQRDWTQAYRRNEALLPVLKRIYEDRAEFWPEYHMCEQLVDVEESFQLWRFRHMKTVERIIGHRRGTGGSSGVSFLKKALDLEFFPELLDVRTVLE